MKKSQLIDLLSDPDLPDVDVFISSDAEGNSFNAIDEISYHQEDYDEDYLDDFGGPVLIIWPV